MLRFYFQWRHRRRQAAASFRLPGERDRSLGMKRTNLESYLSQNSVRGRPVRTVGVPRISGIWLRRLIVLLTVICAGWMVYESTLALIIIPDNVIANKQPPQQPVQLIHP